MNRIPPAFYAKPFAHRGLHDDTCPENSITAIRAAVDAGYGVEFDVQPSADGEAMVFHDYTLGRLTAAEGRTDARSAEALGKIALTGSEEPIPTLTEVLNVIGGRAPVLLEIKDQSGDFTKTDGALERRVCEVVESAGHVDTIAIMSFNPHALGQVRAALPQAYRGIVSYDFEHGHDAHVSAERRRSLAGLTHFDTYECDFASYGAASFPSPVTSALRERGVPLFCWTIRSPEQAAEALKHCDQITFENYHP